MLGEQSINCKTLILRFMHFYEIVQLHFCHVGAVLHTTLIQLEQHFSFAGVTGLVPVDLYIAVRRLSTTRTDLDFKFGMSFSCSHFL
jgi:hypothetical protein